MIVQTIIEIVGHSSSQVHSARCQQKVFATIVTLKVPYKKNIKTLANKSANVTLLR